MTKLFPKSGLLTTLHVSKIIIQRTSTIIIEHRVQVNQKYFKEFISNIFFD